MEAVPESSILTVGRPLRLLLAGLALGGAFDLLFNGKLPGISVGIWALLLLVGLFLAVRWENARTVAANLWLPAGLLFFAAMTFLRANGFLTFLNISAGLFLIALMAAYLTQRSTLEMSLPALLLAPLQAPAGSLHRGVQVTAQWARRDLPGAAKATRRQAVPILRGLLLALPVLALFTALLASADLLFAHRLEHLLSREFLRELGRWVGHGLVIATVGFLAAGGLAYAVRRRAPGWVERLSSLRLPSFPGITEPAVIINAVNVLFFLFVLIQLPYLFGGRLNVTPHGFTYAQYARRGFGELLAVAILTLGLVVLLSALTRRDTPRQRLTFNLSATFLIALTGVMLASAFKRLWLYEMAYGFTRMRIYPHVFMVWLGIALAWFAVTLWLRPGRFAFGLLVAALGFVATLDLLNPDALVVRQNYRRSLETVAGTEAGSLPAFDTQYLIWMSEDAVPALVDVADQTSGATPSDIEKSLRLRLDDLRSGTSWRNWPSFHWSRLRAYRLLMERY